MQLELDIDEQFEQPGAQAIIYILIKYQYNLFIK